MSLDQLFIEPDESIKGNIFYASVKLEDLIRAFNNAPIKYKKEERQPGFEQILNYVTHLKAVYTYFKYVVDHALQDEGNLEEIKYTTLRKTSPIVCISNWLIISGPKYIQKEIREHLAFNRIFMQPVITMLTIEKLLQVFTNIQEVTVKEDNNTLKLKEGWDTLDSLRFTIIRVKGIVEYKNTKFKLSITEDSLNLKAGDKPLPASILKDILDKIFA